MLGCSPDPMANGLVLSPYLCVVQFSGKVMDQKRSDSIASTLNEYKSAFPLNITVVVDRKDDAPKHMAVYGCSEVYLLRNKLQLIVLHHRSSFFLP